MLRDPELENMFKDLIDFSKPPHVPMGWRVVTPEEFVPKKLDLYKRMTGKWRYNDNIGLFSRRKENPTLGDHFRGCFNSHELFGLLVGAQLLDFYLANQHLIPEHWSGHNVYFCGTPYYNEDGHLVVRCLFKNGSRWYWGKKLFDQQLLVNDIIAVYQPRENN